MDTISSLSLIVVLGIACQWLAWWARLPAILFLLITGMLIGPVTGVLNPDELFGDLLFPMVSLSVAVILFEGSLTLKFDEIRGLGYVVRNMISIGTLITWLGMALVTHALLDFPYELSFLFGAVVIVTGPTVIVPILRSVRPNAKIANILRWEGITIDPIGALMAVLVFDFIISKQNEYVFSNILIVFGTLIVEGTLIGIIAAYALNYVLKHHLVPEYLRNVFALALVFAAYAISDLFVHESGLLAVTVMGIILANMKDTDIEDILDFKETLSVLLISGLFIILAARIEFAQFEQLGFRSFGILLALMFVIRPLKVWISSIGSDLTISEKIMISWVGPRGIVAAAIAALFAIRLEEAGFTEASLLVPLTFLIIIGTVVIQSLTSKQIASWLGVREPEPTGVLIIGAGKVARVIGKAIQEQGFKVVMTDSNWENTSLARMEGMSTYFGNPISEHADRNLDLIGVGSMLGLSGRANLDTLAALRFRNEFGSKSVYEVKTSREDIVGDKHIVSTRHRGYQLFSNDITYGTLANWIGNGAEIKKNQLSKTFEFADFQEKYQNNSIQLFAIDPRGKLHFYIAEKELKPERVGALSAWSKPQLLMIFLNK